MQTQLRPARPEDIPAILALNEAAVPAVNSVDHDFMAWSIREAAFFQVACTSVQDDILGFMIGHTPGVTYASENFQWFCAHYPSFVYVDRIVVAPRAKRMGVGTALYDAVSTVAHELDCPAVTCEVNTRPRNDDSLAFHHRYGFHEVGAQETKNGTVAVSLLLKDLKA